MCFAIACALSGDPLERRSYLFLPKFALLFLWLLKYVVMGVSPGGQPASGPSVRLTEWVMAIPSLDLPFRSSLSVE
ncbi:hypothetical protein B0H10DRAFT_2065174 [Mycena sp. CBHHK59/15]|nr:hypothetical protein B0H10DRAFT_2065174 [Mycena sp. CBHHK59/15]